MPRLTTKNQITIPKRVLEKIGAVKYFDVEYREGLVVLKPVTVHETDLENIRGKMKKLGLSEDSVDEAMRWARSR